MRRTWRKPGNDLIDHFRRHVFKKTIFCRSRLSGSIRNRWFDLRSLYRFFQSSDLLLVPGAVFFNKDVASLQAACFSISWLLRPHDPLTEIASAVRLMPI